MLHRLVPLLIASALALAVAGCDGDDPPETPTPTATSSPTGTPTGSPSGSPTVPAYLEKYSEEERAAYEAAVSAYLSFADRQAEINADGRATAAARRFYREATADWRTYWLRLQELESNEIRIIGRGETLSHRPAEIKLFQAGGGQVVMRVCGVARGVEVVQNGTPVPQPSPTRSNVRVAMVKQPDDPMWRVLYERRGSPC